MENFVFINGLIRHGVLFAAAAAAGVAVIGLAAIFAVTAKLFWIVVCLILAVAAFCLVMLLRDIARVIAETLIPLP